MLKIRCAQDPVCTQNPERPLGYTATKFEETSNTRSRIIDSYDPTLDDEKGRGEVGGVVCCR